MKACIIEDEPHARRALQRLLEAVAPDVEVVGSAAGVEEGVALLNRTHPDLVLLDVQLGTHNGFDLLHHFPDPGFSLIFVTAYNHFALDAFRWNAVHYITKPIDSRELHQGIEKVRKEQARLQPIQVQGLLQHSDATKALLLRHGNLVERQPLEDIAYLNADVNLTYFFCVEIDFESGARKVARKTTSIHIGHYARLLPEFFFRCHQSFLVNRDYVKWYDKSKNILLLSTGHEIPVSRRTRDHLNDWLNRSSL